MIPHCIIRWSEISGPRSALLNPDEYLNCADKMSWFSQGVGHLPIINLDSCLSELLIGGM